MLAEKESLLQKPMTTKEDTTKSQRWETIINRWLSSGLTQADFCQREHLKKHQLRYWRNKQLSKESPCDALQKKGFVSLTLPLQGSERRSWDKLSLHFPSGARLEFPLSTDETVITRLFRCAQVLND